MVSAIMKRYDQSWNHSAKYSWNRIMGISGSENGDAVPYKAIFYGDVPLHRPEQLALYMVGTSNLGS